MKLLVVGEIGKELKEKGWGMDLIITHHMHV